ncbi:hypothetical protein SDC9_145704 [bioreactor metagenome]|uniref:Uncharacterized protein n=1 Tax=bioreactor metagenome TaxID=1076179 RepID=A0A645EA57_9ZZZZ
MEHNGEAGQASANLLQNVKAQLGLLPGLEFVGAVAGADGDGQRVHPGGLHKFLDLVWVGVGGVGGRHLDVVLHPGQTAQLPFHHHAVVVGVFHHLAGELDVILKGMLGAVDHHRGEAAVDAGLADLKALAVVQMHADGQAGVLQSGIDELHQVNMLGVFAGAGGNLKN